MVGGAKGRRHPAGMADQPGNREESPITCKPYDIPKALVWEAWLHVKANRGAAGIDAETIERFEEKLGDNLYKVWNRMSSGSYFLSAVKAVPIPRKSGGVRILGIPTVADRVAQTAVKMWLEPRLEPIFRDDSYGYRPGKSALAAITVTRRRCWAHDWVVEFDIRGLFDNLDHGFLMKALRKHCQEPWILLYVERWLKAPMQTTDGQILERYKGTPQGGVISPLLANLFLAFGYARYADDAVLHCKNQRQAENVLETVRERFQACKLELHPGKTRIVYCKDVNRNGDHPDIQFTFLSYTFRRRKAVDKYGRVYENFSPAVSRDALKAMRQTIRGWHLQLMSDKSLADLSAMFGPALRGWQQCYGRFYGSGLKPVWRSMNQFLIRWLTRKHKRLAGHKTRAAEMLGRLADGQPDAFIRWSLGFVS